MRESEELLAAYSGLQQENEKLNTKKEKGADVVAAESDKAVQEVIDRDRHAETLMDMGEHLKERGIKNRRCLTEPAEIN